MRLIILGAGDYGHKIEVLAASIRQYDDIIFLDDDAGLPDAADNFANFVLFMDDDTEFYPAFEENTVRVRWLNHLMSLGCNLASFSSPGAEISSAALILPGTAVFPHARVEDECVIKIGCILKEGSAAERGSVLEAGVSLEENAVVNAGQHIRQFESVKNNCR